jgi:hypothetical protein
MTLYLQNECETHLKRGHYPLGRFVTFGQD